LRTNSKRVRVAGAAVAAVALTAGLAACGGDDLDKGSGGGGGKTITVGSANFTESKVLAEMYAGLLRDAGYKTARKTLDSRELYEPALQKGQIDVVPEYAATLAEWFNAKDNGPKAPDEKPVASSDVDKTVTALTDLSGKRGLKPLAVGKAVDQNAFVVTKDFAAKNKLKTLSDLGKSGQKVKIAAGDECKTRHFCQPGLQQTYGIKITGIVPTGVSTPQTKQAVKDGKAQLGLTNSTDATLPQFGLVFLKDDKHLQNADNVLPVVNEKEAGAKKVATALDKLNRVLTTQDLTDLTRKVDSERQKPEDVAKSYLQDKGLLAK
jgi:osmoprotectant transport system substrate-binding protein